MDTTASIAHDIVWYATLGVCVLIGGGVVWCLVIILWCINNRRYLMRRSLVWLEITPPATATKTPEAVEQFFTVIHGFAAARSYGERIMRRVSVLSCEIVATRQSGVRYLVQVERAKQQALQKAIMTHLPEAKVREITRNITKPTLVVEFCETGHYMLPLALLTTSQQRDPLSYVIHAMTGLSDEEEITFQLVFSPTRVRGAERAAERLMHNENILQDNYRDRLSGGGKLMALLKMITGVSASIVSDITSHLTASHHHTVQRSQPRVDRDRPWVRGTFELAMMQSIYQKVTKPLFRANLRILVTSPDAKRHAEVLKTAMAGYSAPPHQLLKATYNIPILATVRRYNAVNRLPSFMPWNTLTLASIELASLYHFALHDSSQVDNRIVSLSRTLSAPISLKDHPDFSVIIGLNRHHGIETPIGLTEAERARHQYIVGGTGSGKTTMLQYQIVQDMEQGKGLAIIDPHGDMAETMLRYVPPKRIKDVVYFNPDDLDYPLGLNLLEIPPGLEGTALLREKDLITESVVSVFRKLFSDDDAGGHRIEYVLRNAVQTALTQKDATLFTVFNLLNNTQYRRRVIKTLGDKNLVSFWEQEFGKAGGMQKVKMTAGITAKIGRFLFSASAKRILEQPKSTIDFDDIINSGKVLICNVSKGRLGEDTAEPFGVTILAKLQLASLRRARMPQVQRRPFYIYVDEFQNFATTSFVQMLSESRKYGVFMIMAEQSTAQQRDQQTVNIILANVGTIICFRTGSPQDEQRLLALFRPFIEAGEISRLPAHQYYACLAAVHAQEPLSGETLLLTSSGSDAVKQAVITHSRRQYARERADDTKDINTPPKRHDTEPRPSSEHGKTEEKLMVEVIDKE